MIEQILKIASTLLAEAPRARERATRKAAGIRDNVTDRVHNFERRVRETVRPEPQGDTLENIALFVTGLGVGVGLALLFTPTSGSDLRNRIRDGAAEVVDSFRESYHRAADSAEDEEFMGV
jgi:hypothetical protein